MLFVFEITYILFMYKYPYLCVFLGNNKLVNRLV